MGHRRVPPNLKEKCFSFVSTFHPKDYTPRQTRRQWLNGLEFMLVFMGVTVYNTSSELITRRKTWMDTSMVIPFACFKDHALVITPDALQHDEG
jgi:hypothetical protein